MKRLHVNMHVNGFGWVTHIESKSSIELDNTINKDFLS